jgi:hypothetical protein
MRMSISLRGIVLLMAAVSPALVCAQFHQPSDEELKMTSDPAAPGAAAVYLEIKQSDGIDAGFSDYYARIKVLAEKGKELATVEIPYFKNCEQVTLVKGRTIHPDGTIVPLDVKPEDLLAVKVGDEQIQRKVFTLPSVEVGSVLEYKYQKQYLPCAYGWFLSWDVQKPYLIHKSHYAYTGASFSGDLDAHGDAAKGMQICTVLPPGLDVRNNAIGNYVLDANDVAPIPDEEWMPPLDAIVYRVHFYFVNANNTDEFWMHESKLWSDSIHDFAVPSKAIRDAVAGLVAPGDSDLDKARKLYAAVQALDNTDFTRARSESERRHLKLKDVHRAEDTWAEKSGSGNDLALLYLAMLRAAGLHAYPMEVSDRDKHTFNLYNTTMDQLDSFVVIANLGGKEIFLDPGQKMCPFGMLGWKHTGAGGIRESAEGYEMGNTPLQPYTENAKLRTGDLTVDAAGAVSGQLRIAMSGQEALYWRQEALENDETEMKKEFDSELEATIPEGVEAHVSHFDGLNDPGSYLVAAIDVKGSLGVATAKRLVLPGFFLETRGTEPFVHEEKRQTAVDMHYAAKVTDRITYRLPAELKLEGGPPDVKNLWKDHAVHTARMHSEPGQITAERTVARAFTLAKPEEYGDLRGFYQKVAEADQAQLVLTIDSSTPPAGKSH